ncbi:MAG: pyridoxal-phosphate dependent enzyme [Betaproteobacteria bacterium]|nr:pyridoxal-phosphate dependent enzyme [Betaproteobacteria bacterium]
MSAEYPVLDDFVGNTPLVRFKRLPGRTTNVVLGKLEGNNPAGSVKDRPALSMILGAEARGEIRPGDTLIEPTSGNTGIALAMVAAMRGYRMVLVMPEDLSVERRQTMAAYGAAFVLTPKQGGMETARDIALAMQARGEGRILDQFANAREEGIFGGVSAGGATWAALELSKQVEDSVIVTIICDRGDRYLSTGIFG